MFQLDQIFCDKIFVKKTLGIQFKKKFIIEGQIIDILLKYILWYDFFNDLDA